MKISRAHVALWRAPLLLAAMTAVGLVSALLGDRWWDALSWLLLAVPIAVVLWFGVVRTSGP